jgi:trehalose 6-phosphate synthase/phosphatase
MAQQGSQKPGEAPLHQGQGSLATSLRFAAEAATPGIHLSTYQPEATPQDEIFETPSYFSQADRPISAEPEAIATSPREAAAGAKTGQDILRRMSLAAMGRRESLSEIRSGNPDLALSGNIISATFNIPHAFRYRKGADWVCFSHLFRLCFCFRLPF